MTNNTDTEAHAVSMELKHTAKSICQHIKVRVKVHNHYCTPYNDRTEMSGFNLFSMSYFFPITCLRPRQT